MPRFKNYNEKDVELMKSFRGAGFTYEEIQAIFSDEHVAASTIAHFTKGIVPNKDKKEELIVKLRDLFLSWGEGKPLEELPLSPEFIKILKEEK